MHRNSQALSWWQESVPQCFVQIVTGITFSACAYSYPDPVQKFQFYLSTDITAPWCSDILKVDFCQVVIRFKSFKLDSMTLPICESETCVVTKPDVPSTIPHKRSRHTDVSSCWRPRKLLVNVHCKFISDHRWQSSWDVMIFVWMTAANRSTTLHCSSQHTATTTVWCHYNNMNITSHTNTSGSFSYHAPTNRNRLPHHIVHL